MRSSIWHSVTSSAASPIPELLLAPKAEIEAVQVIFADEVIPSELPPFWMVSAHLTKSEHRAEGCLCAPWTEATTD